MKEVMKFKEAEAVFRKFCEEGEGDLDYIWEGLPLEVVKGLVYPTVGKWVTIFQEEIGYVVDDSVVEEYIVGLYLESWWTSGYVSDNFQEDPHGECLKPEWFSSIFEDFMEVEFDNIAEELSNKVY